MTPERDGLEFFRFLNQSDDFARGVQVGEFWARAERGDPTIEDEFDVRLEGELLRVAALFGFRRVEWCVVGDGRAAGVFVSNATTG